MYRAFKINLYKLDKKTYVSDARLTFSLVGCALDVEAADSFSDCPFVLHTITTTNFLSSILYSLKGELSFKILPTESHQFHENSIYHSDHSFTESTMLLPEYINL